MNAIKLTTALFVAAGLTACATPDTIDYGDSGPKPNISSGPGPVFDSRAEGRITSVPPAQQPAVVTVAPATVAVAPAPVTVVPSQPAPLTAYRTGSGVVESVAMVRYANPIPSATAGGSTQVAPAYRLGVRMNDGTTQVFDQTYPDFRVGDRIQITADGRLLR